jgi:hypothetical protein
MADDAARHMRRASSAAARISFATPSRPKRSLDRMPVRPGRRAGVAMPRGGDRAMWNARRRSAIVVTGPREPIHLVRLLTYTDIPSRARRGATAPAEPAQPVNV